jgi:beta-glucosidase/6-phospho-beta-glucosidase/beta-galactosidase
MIQPTWDNTSAAPVIGSARPPGAAAEERASLLQSFLMGGFEGSSHRRFDGHQLDLVAMTRHDVHAAADYQMLTACGIGTVRDALRWHVIEQSPYQYCWASFLPMLHAASRQGVQVIWDLCHYGLPHDIDIWSTDFIDRFAAFAAATARVVAAETDAVPFYCPLNEMSYWAWAGGEFARMYPFATGRGPELKRQLARAAIAAIEAVRSVDSRARFVQAEPLINVVGVADKPGDIEAAETHRRSQYEVFDMIAGRLAPELGGSEDHLDIIGLNFYFNNQWYWDGPTIPFGDAAYRPLRWMLTEVAARYGRPMLIAETGAEGSNGAGWLHYVCGEVRAARRAGAFVEGICIYPIMDYPGWDNFRHCRCGLIRAEDDWQTRVLDPELRAQILEEQGVSIRPGA